MLLKKQGFPEEGELVFCTVTKIFGHSVFANLDEYGRQGMINISEISPGRIRNLRDFVVEGKKIVCVVLRINKEKGYIDLSLRRVNESQRKKKIEQIQLEQKAEKVIEFIAREMSMDLVSFYKDIMAKISSEFASLHDCFSAIINDNKKLKDFGIREDIAQRITEVVKDRMKPTSITIAGDLSIQIFTPEGVETIKEAFKKAEDIGKANLSIKYLGGGSYHIIVTAMDYKKGEKILKDCLDAITKIIESNKGAVLFKRKED